MIKKKRQRGVLANVDLIQGLRTLKGWTLQDLADKEPKVSLRSIQNLVAGHPVDMATISLVAKKFSMTYEELMVSKSSKKTAITIIGDIGLVIEGDYSKLTKDDIEELLRQLGKIIQNENGIQIMKTESGSIKFTLRMTIDDAEKLQQAFKENRLASLKAISVGEFVPVEDTTTTPATEREILSDRSLLQNNRYRLAQHMIGWSSIICGIISFLPLRLESISIFGILMACACGVMSIRTKSGYWLTMLAVAATVAGMAYWMFAHQKKDNNPSSRATNNYSGEERVSYSVGQIPLPKPAPLPPVNLIINLVDDRNFGNKNRIDEQVFVDINRLPIRSFKEYHQHDLKFIEYQYCVQPGIHHLSIRVDNLDILLGDWDFPSHNGGNIIDLTMTNADIIAIAIREK